MIKWSHVRNDYYWKLFIIYYYYYYYYIFIIIIIRKLLQYLSVIETFNEIEEEENEKGKFRNQLLSK